MDSRPKYGKGTGMANFVAQDLADIHNHLVPGVDDGSKSPSESMRYLEIFRAGGVTRLATSSHLQGWLALEPGAVAERLARLEAAWLELKKLCQGRDDVPELRFSQEILVPRPDLAEKVFDTPGVGLRGTRYALCEFGFDPEGDMRDVIRVVREAGRQPIVAHPERYRMDGGTMPIETIRGWKDAGALLQVNDGSVLGDYGDSIERLAWQLLEEGLADLMGSDNHADSRPIAPADAGRILAARGADEQARLLLSENVQRILDDRDTLPVPAAPKRKAAA